MFIFSKFTWILSIVICINGNEDCLTTEGDPCDTNLVLTDWRRSIRFGTEMGILISDDFIIDGWYKLRNEGDRIDIRMPTSSPGLLKCGTVFPVWIDGTYPALGDEVKTVTGCVPTSGACEYSIDLCIKACSTEDDDTYFVHYLIDTPGTSMGYCTDSLLPCDGNTTSSTGFPPCYVTTEVNHLTSTGFTDLSATDVKTKDNAGSISFKSGSTKTYSDSTQAIVTITEENHLTSTGFTDLFASDIKTKDNAGSTSFKSGSTKTYSESPLTPDSTPAIVTTPEVNPLTSTGITDLSTTDITTKDNAGSISFISDSTKTYSDSTQAIEYISSEVMKTSIEQEKEIIGTSIQIEITSMSLYSKESLPIGDDDPQSNTVFIVIGVCLLAVLIIALFVLGLYIWRRRSDKNKEENTAPFPLYSTPTNPYII